MNPRFPLIAVCLLGLLAALRGTPACCQAEKPQLVVQAEMIKLTNSVAFSPDGKILANGSGDGLGKNTIKLWDIETGQLWQTLIGHTDIVTTIAFSPDGKTLASGSWDKTVKLWDMATGRLWRTLIGHTNLVTSVAFSPDGKTVASGSDDGTVKLWDTATGKELHTLKGHTREVWSIAFTPDGKTLASGGGEDTVKLWNTTNGKEIASLYTLGGDDWAVVALGGLFDASPGGLMREHYVVGLEPINLSQLKERYYEPGLLAKLIGFNKEPLRNVPPFDHVDLYPSIQVPTIVPADGKLSLSLTNRGGGIGRVQVFVNGIEFVPDAHGPQDDPDAKTATLTVNVAHAPGLVPGRPNIVRIVTWNTEGYLASRGIEAVYTPHGP